MAIPSSYKEFDVWVNESKQALHKRNFGNPSQHEWSIERRLLAHYQSPEEFFAGECTGYCSQDDGSVRVDIWELGEHMTVEEAIALVKAQYVKRTTYLTEIVEKQLTSI